MSLYSSDTERKVMEEWFEKTTGGKFVVINGCTYVQFPREKYEEMMDQSLKRANDNMKLFYSMRGKEAHVNG